MSIVLIAVAVAFLLVVGAVVLVVVLVVSRKKKGLAQHPYHDEVMRNKALDELQKRGMGDVAESMQATFGLTEEADRQEAEKARLAGHGTPGEAAVLRLESTGTRQTSKGQIVKIVVAVNQGAGEPLEVAMTCYVDPAYLARVQPGSSAPILIDPASPGCIALDSSRFATTAAGAPTQACAYCRQLFPVGAPACPNCGAPVKRE